jgi:hypothetical protein
MFQSVKVLTAAVSLALLAGAVPAYAGVIPFLAILDAASMLPATDSTGTGELDGKYDSSNQTFTWTITYTGLSGDVIAADFHGPARAGANADIVFPVTSPFASPISGSMVLTAAQFGQLKDQRWYVVLHTAKNPDGEIRGQAKPVRP